MKIKNMEQTIMIIAKEPYTLDTLYALLTEKGRFEGGNPEMKKFMGIPCIFFPGTDGFRNVVTVSKNKITIAQQKDSVKGFGLSMALDSLTSGWSSLLNVEGKKNLELMKAIGSEIERLVT